MRRPTTLISTVNLITSQILKHLKMNNVDLPTTQTDTISSAQIRLPSNDLKMDLPFFQRVLGFKLDKIFPADDPAVAILSGHGLCLRLERGALEAPATLRLLCDRPQEFADGKTEFIAPNGCRIEVVSAHSPLIQPQTQHAFSVRHLRDSAPWVIGRAGMQYRDLVPNRLGGAMIASHIRIPEGGPVPDMVHYHTIGFQLIFCYRGWVRLVYEDQGPAFVLEAGDCVIQPPEIRHRVLESSDNLEVVEIGVPADHETTIDHTMELPTSTQSPDRIFGGQRFCHAEVAEARWQPFRINGFDYRETGINDATNGIANVVVARYNGNTPLACQHNSDILFTYVLQGSMTLTGEDECAHELAPGDAFVVPPAFNTQYSACSNDLELLEVSLPGVFDTTRQ
jgi:quercetin dioxygenase-like cupin family protein